MEKLRINRETPITKDMTEDELHCNVLIHQLNVRRCLNEFVEMIEDAIDDHDYTKINNENNGVNEDFYDMIINKNHDNGWWKRHQKIERHHLNDTQFVQDDVNLIDIMEMIADGFAAGVGRNGYYENRYNDIDMELLFKAFKNTIKILEDKELELR